MLLFPLGCAIVGLFTWRRLRPPAHREENGGKLLLPGRVNSGLLTSIITVLLISQLAKVVKWAENRISRDRNGFEADSVGAPEGDDDSHSDVLFWFNPLASIFADEIRTDTDCDSRSSCYSADDEQQQEAAVLTQPDSWICETELPTGKETRCNARLFEELDHIVGTTVRRHVGFHDRLVRESEQRIDTSPRLLWAEMPWMEIGNSATIDSHSLMDITASRHAFQRRSHAARFPYAVSQELQSEKLQCRSGSNNVDVGSQNSSKGAGNMGVEWYGADEKRRRRTANAASVEGETMDRQTVGHTDAQLYYSRNRRKPKGKEGLLEGRESDEFTVEDSYDDEINRSLPYMRELEAVWRRASDRSLLRGRFNNHEHSQFSELLDFWRHVDHISPQHTYTLPASAPVSPSNSSSSCSSPR